MFKEHLGGSTQQAQYLSEKAKRRQLKFIAKIVLPTCRIFD
jgi:hypothetical protein